MADLTLHSNTESFIGDIKRLVEQGRNAAYGAVNAMMIETYWRIGQRIVEQEQNGKERAEYGTQLIKSLSEVLVADYGNNFNEKNLRAFRSLYLLFSDLEIWNTRVPNLTWSHYRALLRVGDADARIGICTRLQKKCGASGHLTATLLPNTITVCCNRQIKMR